MSIIISSMDNAYVVFTKVLQGYGFDLTDHLLKKLHYGNWVLISRDGFSWYFKYSKEFFHLKGECESVDVELLDKIRKNEMIQYMTFVFAHHDKFYSISYNNFINKRDPVPYVGHDNIRRWLIPKKELMVWHVIT